MTKAIGYIIGAVGIILFALGYPKIRTIVGLPASLGIPDIIILIIGAIALLIGAYLAFKTSNEQPKEVPIYEGTGENRKIVAIQRLKK